MSITLPEDLLEQLDRLARQKDTTPAALVREWIRTYDVVEPAPPAKPRTPNLGKGRMQMEDDFDEYLGDDFWFGDDGMADKI